jgi:hypothetical protein
MCGHAVANGATDLLGHLTKSELDVFEHLVDRNVIVIQGVEMIDLAASLASASRPVRVHMPLAMAMSEFRQSLKSRT